MTRDQAEIKIDLDDTANDPRLDDMTRLLNRAGYKVLDYAMRRSPSGNGWHVILEVSPQPQSPYEVVALQLLLGSDKNREAMQMHRARSFPNAPPWMQSMWNVLYLPHPHRQRHLTLENRNAK